MDFKVGDKVIIKDCPGADRYYYTKAGSIGVVLSDSDTEDSRYVWVNFESVTGGDIQLPKRFSVDRNLLELYLDVIVVDLID